MNEKEVINAVRRHLSAAPLQKNEIFAADAETVLINNCLQAITIDEFSAEDCLPVSDGECLGWNLVAATISDLLASGACPLYLLNSLVAAPWMDEVYLHSLSRGIQTALSVCNAYMLGGDAGAGNDWHFTGVAIGNYTNNAQMITRRIEATSGVIMATGCFGDGNLGAIGKSAPRFPIRKTESVALSDLTKQASLACIDTSDGFCSALATLAQQNPRLCLKVDLASVFYAPNVKTVAAEMSIPPETFLVGSAGEYELVALVPAGESLKLEKCDWNRIGEFSAEVATGLFYYSADRSLELIKHDTLPDPRNAMSLSHYQQSVIEYATRQFARTGGV